MKPLISLKNLFIFLFTALPASTENATYAYITLISGEKSDGYVAGAVALSNSLQISGSKISRYSMITSDVPNRSRKRLTDSGWKLLKVKLLSKLMKRIIYFDNKLSNKKTDNLCRFFLLLNYDLLCKHIIFIFNLNYIC